MTLTLVTGPANAAKAGAVFDSFRAALPLEPLLVVPTSADVEHYQRELASDGVVFGGEVVTFSRLIRLIAERAVPGPPTRPLGRTARERVVRAAIADVRFEALAASAAAPGFAAAVGRLLSELERSLVGAGRFADALAAWGEASGRHAFAAEVAGLYTSYARRLEALGRHDAEGFAWAALDALRARPSSWPGRPVFLYGFDDLTPTELDAIEALARVAGADVTVTLPYEPGRAALAGRARAVEALRPLADEHVALAERSEHYSAGARPALHHLERTLFEDPGERRPPNGAVRLLESGGERAEVELVGAAILELTDRGVPAEEIAVLYRSVGEAAPLVEQVLGAYGIPVASDRPVALGRTRLGAGLLAFARAGLGEGTGTAQDLLTWLRTPGKLRRPELADALEARLRRSEITGVGEARRLWEAERWPLSELDALAVGSRVGIPEFVGLLERELEAIWTAPHRRAAAVLGPVELADARVAAAVRGALGELRALHDAGPALVADARAVLEALAALEVRERTGVRGAGEGVLLSDPLAIRARRFRAVFVCGLQDGAFPLRPGPEPFLDDAERRELARASGLVLPLHEDVADRERSLFYACVSRPEEVLYLSWRSSDEEGNPLQPSPFVAEVRERFDAELWTERGRRLLADVTWPPALAPTPLELRRARAFASAPAAGEEVPSGLGAPVSGPVLELLAARERESAGGLESFAACSMRWLVGSLMRPGRIEPDPEPMRRGSLAHAVLERTLRGLRERTGTARLNEATLPEAVRELAAALRELGGTPAGARARAALRALELDLRRVLREEARTGPGFEPERLEWAFGGEGDEHPGLALEGVSVSGRVDRIDTGEGGGNQALVRDYKNRAVHPGAKWAQDGRLQVALYALAARELLGLDPVGAIYQPLSGGDLRPRGLVCDETEGTAWVGTDVVAPGAFDCALGEARAAAERAAADLHAGRITACPERCTPRGECAFPAICRATG